MFTAHVDWFTVKKAQVLICSSCVVLVADTTMTMLAHRTNFLTGSEEATVQEETMRSIVESEPIFDNVQRLHMNHKQHYEAGMRKIRRMIELKMQMNLTEDEYRKLAVSAIAASLV